MSYKKYEIKLNQSLIIHFFMHSLLNYFFNERDNAFNMSSIIIITSSNYQIQQEILVPSIKEASQLSILVYKYLLSLIKSVCSIFPPKMPKSYLKKEKKIQHKKNPGAACLEHMADPHQKDPYRVQSQQYYKHATPVEASVYWS